MDPNDANAIDIKYHIYCWVKYVQRAKQNTEVKRQLQTTVQQITADTEFYNMLQSLLQAGKINVLWQ